MGDQDQHQRKVRLRYLIIILLAEKVIQHVFVTASFYFNSWNIGSTVAVSPALLMVLGGLLAVLYAVTLWAMLTRRSWAIPLTIALALCDIVGEFAAQGTLGIGLNVSFIVATALLILAVLYRRRAQAIGGAQHA